MKEAVFVWLNHEIFSYYVKVKTGQVKFNSYLLHHCVPQSVFFLYEFGGSKDGKLLIKLEDLMICTTMFLGNDATLCLDSRHALLALLLFQNIF